MVCALTAPAVRVAMIGQKGYPPVHGGIERHVAELAWRLPAHGFQIDIFSRPHYSEADGPVDVPGVCVRKLPSIPTKHLDAISHTALATWQAIFQDYDIVHYHALGPGLLSGLPRWLAGRSTLVTVHGLDWQRGKWGRFAQGVLRLGEVASAVFPDRTIVVSEALRAYFLTTQGRQTDYIPNGIAQPNLLQPDLIRQAGVQKAFVLFVGRLVPEKGCHLLLDAWARMPAQLKEGLQLVVAGDTSFSSHYVADLRDEAQNDVLFLGYVHGPILDELYTNAAIVVLPSTLEGLSITLLEGMSYGRCCLVSDIPPNLEAAGGCAATFQSGQVPDLVEQMSDLLNSPGKRQEFGEEAQRRVLKRYSWDRVASQTADLYRLILEECC